MFKNAFEKSKFYESKNWLMFFWLCAIVMNSTVIAIQSDGFCGHLYLNQSHGNRCHGNLWLNVSHYKIILLLFNLNIMTRLNFINSHGIFWNCKDNMLF